MTAYRENAYREPPRVPCWRRMLAKLRDKAQAWAIIFGCVRHGHAVARHTKALGWCARCHTPMAWLPAKGASNDRQAWEAIRVDDWTHRHELSVAAGFDRPCAERARAREAGRN